MTRLSTPTVVLLVAAIMAALAQPAAAEGPVLTKAALFNDPATQQGLLSLAMVYDSGDPFAGTAPPEGSSPAPTPLLDIAAASAEVVDYRYTHRESSQGSLTSTAPVRRQVDLQDAVIQMAAFQRGFQVHIYGLDGADLAYDAQTDGGQLTSAAGPVEMSRGLLGKDQPASTSEGSDAPDFAVVERAGPMLLQTESAPRLRLMVSGDLVIEVMGLTLRAQDAETDVMVESGSWRRPMQPLPPGGDALLYEQDYAFIRIILRGATVELGSDGGTPNLRWASRHMESEFTGPVTLEPAGDAIRDADPSQRTVIPAGSRLILLPQADAMSVEVTEGRAGTQGTIASIPAPASAALIGTGAILALAIAIGIGVLRRVLRLPAMADVEKAIEEGEYRKAARLGARILARLPGSEAALLGRAIALSKSGRHQDVVAEVTRHLAQRPASDGTLHYVLGLAQLDSGRPTEGQASLREAVRLTPSLQAEVAPRLGKAFSVAQPTTRETHGYA